MGRSSCQGWLSSSTKCVLCPFSSKNFGLPDKQDNKAEKYQNRLQHAFIDPQLFCVVGRYQIAIVSGMIIAIQYTTTQCGTCTMVQDMLKNLKRQEPSAEVKDVVDDKLSTTRGAGKHS